MNRDDFSVLTRDRLAKRVGVRCSNPSCRKLTTGPRTESTHIINIGVAAHITAAASGGPRFDSSLSSERRPLEPPLAKLPGTGDRLQPDKAG